MQRLSKQTDQYVGCASGFAATRAWPHKRTREAAGSEHREARSDQRQAAAQVYVQLAITVQRTGLFVGSAIPGLSRPGGTSERNARPAL
jgi:hypothetical protein